MPRSVHGFVRVPGGRCAWDGVAGPWLESRGWLGAEGPAGAEGRTVLYKTARRENARHAAGPAGRPLFEKRLSGLTLSDALKGLVATGALVSPIGREWIALRRAQASGILVPRPYAAFERRRGLVPRAGFLLVEELPGRALHDLALEAEAVAPAARRDLARRVGAAIADLHEAGIAFGELVAKHVFVDEAPSGPGPAVGFLDLATATLRKRVLWRRRTADLAALGASLARRSVSEGLRLRFLAAYLAACRGRLPSVRTLARNVTRAMGPRYRRRGFRPSLATSPQGLVAQRALGDGWHVLEAELAAEPGLEAWIRAQSPGPAWTSSGAFSILRTSERAAFETWRASKLLLLFGVEAARPVALKVAGAASVIVLRNGSDGGRSLRDAVRSVPGDRGLARSAGAMLTSVFRAGLLPGPDFLESVRVLPSGAVAIAPGAPLQVPRRIRALPVRRAAGRLAKEAAALGFRDATLRDLHARLARDAVNAALGP